MTDPLPVRLSDEGRTATWNPAMTPARRIILSVRRPDGKLEERSSLNSGRARVRADERIESVLSAGE
ncbi:MAG: hypothetical protein M3483_00315 [Gemmatimonadota bacterium]|nr:hypothetical protein [Gemmatimonadota bacterium]